MLVAQEPGGTLVLLTNDGVLADYGDGVKVVCADEAAGTATQPTTAGPPRAATAYKMPW